MKTKYYIASPIGTLCLAEEEQYLVELTIANDATPSTGTPSPIIRQTITELSEYFAGKRTTFTIPIKANGTAFQEKVWAALREIPYGTTKSYGDIAKAIGQPKACRAVGGANNKNSIIILIPCHRVIGANGSMVGFGCGLDVKEYLLNLEQNSKQQS